MKQLFLSLLFSIIAVTAQAKEIEVEAMGVSCGGPLDSKTGRVLSPPNLPG